MSDATKSEAAGVPMDGVSRTGRCLCGSVRFEFDGTPAWAGHCHCESCRRNCSAPFTTFLGVRGDAARWTGATPSVYESSPGVRRLFCGTCGSPMAFEADHYPGEIHFYAASLDRHAGFAPTSHVHHAEKVPWVHLADDLKRFPHSGS